LIAEFTLLDTIYIWEWS